MKVLSKFELYKRMERFAADDKRLLSWPYFAELAGFDPGYLREIFLYKRSPLTETVQIRVSKALERLEKGEVTLVRWKDNSRELRYNNEAKPRLVKAGKLVMRDGKVQLAMGPVNRGDYSQPTLQEQLGKK